MTQSHCFEVFIDRQASLMARAQTWSNYKKHNTCKFLIGITPQGSVSFISKGWGGRVSNVRNVVLFQSCRLEMLSQQIVASQLIRAGVYCAEVKVPPFTRGKKQ